jgi:type VI protein secretion system component Hcp
MAATITVLFPNIKGNSATEKDAFDVSSWHWGMSNSGSCHINGANTTTAAADVRDLTFTKIVDTSSTIITKNCFLGTDIASGKTITLSMWKPSDGGPWWFLKITLSGKAIISSYSVGEADASGNMLETISVNFEKVKLSYCPEDPKKAGAKGTAVDGFEQDIPKHTST